MEIRCSLRLEHYALLAELELINVTVEGHINALELVYGVRKHRYAHRECRVNIICNVQPVDNKCPLCKRRMHNRWDSLKPRNIRKIDF